MIPFVVLSLPRSRSFWLSRFLSSEERPVAHDISRHFKSRVEIHHLFADPHAAVVDTALGLIWADLHIPGVRVLVLHRDVGAVIFSMQRLGMSVNRIPEYDAQLRALPGFHLEQADLESERGAAEVYRYATGCAMPPTRWRDMIGKNLQADVGQVGRDALANIAGIRAVFGGA